MSWSQKERQRRRRQENRVVRQFARKKVVFVRNAHRLQSKRDWGAAADKEIRRGAEHCVENEAQRAYYTSVIMKRAPLGTVPRIVRYYKNAPHAWLFVGKNASKKNLPGRPEHTDALAAHVAGTWHWQASGFKRWHLSAGRERRSILCRPNDLLLIDTSYWRHRTEIPPQPELSVSIARDFSMPQNAYMSIEQAPTNIDATLAANTMKPGDIVLTEDDLPECALPRSASPNCFVGICPDTHKYLLLAKKPLLPGDLLTVADSSDSDDCDDTD